MPVVRSTATRAIVAAAAVVALQCAPAVSLTPPPAASPAPVVALSGASVFIGVGDIASCDSKLSMGTAVLVDSVLRADSIGKVDNAVFTLGDNAYTSGTTAQFNNCFTRTWGDPAKRIIKSVHPSPGNHEYYTPNADPYYKFFGPAAGTVGKGYYSYDVGKWHIIVVNSEIIVNMMFTDSARAAQMDWVEKDIKSHKVLCTIAYWHNPRFSSGWHGSDRKLGPIWQLLYDNDVDLILSGHDHDYERFRPMNPSGLLDTLKGITSIVAGTGGEELRGFTSVINPNSAYRIEGRAGVLLLTLGAAEYRSAFLEVGGRIWDQSGGKCH
ncbi:MAG TPA: metallophosphoesterase [Gemmatimonadaceae bacterium]|nr:metallophosphoesterase [Gemmatimonadaceae bacterium]